MSEKTENCRIDVWLWRARFYKTRGLATRSVAEGHVRLSRNGLEIKLDKPSYNVRRGDILRIARGARQLSVQVEALGVRRGPAAEARELYVSLGEAVMVR